MISTIHHPLFIHITMTMTTNASTSHFHLLPHSLLPLEQFIHLQAHFLESLNVNVVHMQLRPTASQLLERLGTVVLNDTYDCGKLLLGQLLHALLKTVLLRLWDVFDFGGFLVALRQRSGLLVVGFLGRWVVSDRRPQSGPWRRLVVRLSGRGRGRGWCGDRLGRSFRP